MNVHRKWLLYTVWESDRADCDGTAAKTRGVIHKSFGLSRVHVAPRHLGPSYGHTVGSRWWIHKHVTDHASCWLQCTRYIIHVFTKRFPFNTADSTQTLANIHLKDLSVEMTRQSKGLSLAISAWYLIIGDSLAGNGGTTDGFCGAEGDAWAWEDVG